MCRKTRGGKEASNSCVSFSERLYIYIPLVEQETLIEIRRISDVHHAREIRFTEIDIINHVNHHVATVCRYRDCLKQHASLGIFMTIELSGNAVPKNDLIAGEESLEGHYTRPSERQQVNRKERTEGRWEFNISLIVSPLSNLAATAL